MYSIFLSHLPQLQYLTASICSSCMCVCGWNWQSPLFLRSGQNAVLSHQMHPERVNSSGTCSCWQFDVTPHYSKEAACGESSFSHRDIKGMFLLCHWACTSGFPVSSLLSGTNALDNSTKDLTCLCWAELFKFKSPAIYNLIKTKIGV